MIEEVNRVPAHVAIILDGNGRWAKAKGLPRTAGHFQGAKAVEEILVDARPQDEVSALMKLLKTYLTTSIKKSMKNKVKCRVIGERSRLAPDILEAIEKLEEATKDNTGLQFTIAINYGSRDEITRAVKKIATEVKQQELQVEEITEEVIARHLDSYPLPDPDLLIRTCGEQRISNFLLWQCAYTEFYYTPVAWPDFNKEELEKAIASYGKRDRKYGGLH